MNIHPLYFSLFPQGATVTSRAHGPDLSKYDLRFDPETATAQLDFAIQRICYRTTRDEAFDTLLPGVMSVGIRGGYAYLNSDKTWKEQADAYLRFIAGYDYHFHNCDFEGAFNVLSTDFAYQAWQWIHYVQDRTGKPTLLYTSPSLYNQYIAPSQSRFGINWNTVDLWTAQWFFVPNPDGTPSNPTGRTAGWKFWQYTEKGDGTLYGLGRPTAGDLNVFNGTVQGLREYLELGGVQPQEYQKIRRFDSDCHVLIIDPAQTSVRVSKTNGALETVSAAARRYGAKYAINGDMWDDALRPQSLAASNGHVYQSMQLDFRPFLNVDRSDRAAIRHTGFSDLYNTASGVRYIVSNGVKPTYLFETTPEYTERHPRTAVGLLSDGRLVFAVVDGRSQASAGVTLSELAGILIEFGVVVGIDFDGGGSSAIWVQDRIANVPSDGHERAVVNHVLIGSSGVTPMAKYKVTITWDGGARERGEPSIYATQYRNILADNTVHYADADPVPDKDDPTNADKQWIKLQSGWYIAVKYPSSSGIIERARVELVAPEPQPEPVDEVLVNVNVDLTATINGKAYHGAAILNNVQLRPVE